MENCYFFTTKKGDDTFVVPLCLECHDTKFPKLGWFWPGEDRGYGPFLFKCDKCEKVIYEHEETASTD